MKRHLRCLFWKEFGPREAYTDHVSYNGVCKEMHPFQIIALTKAGVANANRVVGASCRLPRYHQH